MQEDKPSPPERVPADAATSAQRLLNPVAPATESFLDLVTKAADSLFMRTIRRMQESPLQQGMLDSPFLRLAKQMQEDQRSACGTPPPCHVAMQLRRVRLGAREGAAASGHERGDAPSGQSDANATADPWPARQHFLYQHQCSECGDPDQIHHTTYE
jgi:hypothetical protein